MQEVTFSPSVEIACFTFVPEEDEQSGFKTLLTSHVGALFCFRIIIKCYPRSLGRLQKSQGRKKTVSFPGRWWSEDVTGRCVEPRRQVTLCNTSESPMLFSKNSVNLVSWGQISEVLVPAAWWQINMRIYKYEVENYFPPLPGWCGKASRFYGKRGCPSWGAGLGACPPSSSSPCPAWSLAEPSPAWLPSPRRHFWAQWEHWDWEQRTGGGREAAPHPRLGLPVALGWISAPVSTWAKVSPWQERSDPTEDPKAMRWLSRRVQKFAFWWWPSNVSRCFGFYTFFG